MKAITIAGNLGKDAEKRQTQSGQVVTNFTVAVEHRDGQNKSTIWFGCSMWGKRGEAIAQYLTKGTKVAVSGDFSTREHDGKTYLQINANDVTLMGGGNQQSGGQSGSGYGGGGSANSGGRDLDDLEDEVPF